MSEIEQTAAKTLQTLGCIWLVSILAVTIVIFAFFNNISAERAILISEEVSLLLAHLIILLHREPMASDYNWDRKKLKEIKYFNISINIRLKRSKLKLFLMYGSVKKVIN